MKHNPIRMQYDALLEMQKEAPADMPELIGYVWAGIDDLTHDGYSIADYETDIIEAINEWGDVLQHSDLDELRWVVNNDEGRYQLHLWGATDDVNASMEYMRKLADAVDYLYKIHGPFYCRFDDGEMTLQITRSEDESDITYEMTES